MHRELDIVVFGASGFTGQYVALDLAKRAEQTPGLRWAIAGRSAAKLRDVQDFITSKLPAYAQVPMILADVHDAASLVAMAKQTAVLLNCTGPYEYFGEPVVAACVDACTHYLDITGEAHFILDMMVKYDARAKAANCLVVSAVGFDSVPTETIALFSAAQFPSAGVVATTEVLMGVDSDQGHATTYECIVLMATPAHWAKTAAAYALVRPASADVVSAPPLQTYYLTYDRRIGKFAFVFTGADKYLLSLSHPGVQTQVYFYVKHVGQLLALMVFGLLLATLGQFTAGRQLMIKYPAFFTAGAFTHKGPTETQMAKASFTHHCIARGYKDAAQNEGRLDYEVVARLDGPEPGYVATPIFMVEAALCVVRDVAEGKLPRGVATPGVAFKNSALISQLQARGMVFSVTRAGPV
ncbi:saccharopine dehydrogenase-like oxidoreductase [Achlya hypogyna]|uniref:Saccharopine dehydrogenase-like oxidoreductase n=1 Tax=Achlya hypogyna TaxID=1202772 RepID=A0A1V9YDP6_ACHHY|nr:saccharopine dehydrogenase-like oxidoreductase [Achlya hypogyna]